MVDKSDLNQALESVPWLEELSQENTQKLANISHLTTIEAQKFVFREGDIEDFIYILISAWIRISNNAAEKGFNLEHFGKILHARYHSDFGAIVDKVQVTIYTDPEQLHTLLGNARKAYDYRNKRLADLTDDRVEEFYSCTLCQSFAPNHVCVISPERLGLCGAYNWLDCKASFSINPTGPNQPIKLGKSIDLSKGYWSGTNDFAKIGSHGVVNEVSMYSIMENPMTAWERVLAPVLGGRDMEKLGFAGGGAAAGGATGVAARLREFESVPGGARAALGSWRP